MRCINRVTLLGRIDQAPTCRDGGGKPVCNFTVETIEEWVSKQRVERRVVQHHCTAFGPVADAVGRAAVPGWVYLEGALRDVRGDSGNGGNREIVCFVVIPVLAQEAA